MKRGFSLFEILLALSVLSVLIVGGIEYANRKRQEAAAQQIGLRLYQYGVAVSDYARQNPQGLKSLDVYGVDWLKNTLNPESCQDPTAPSADTCKTFLGQDFTLNPQISHLVIEVFPGATNPEDAQVYTRLVALPAPSTSLTVELVQLGRIFRLEKGDQEYVIDLGLASRAINFANNFTDQYGSARIQYILSSMDENGYIIGDSNTAGPNVDYGYLLTSGQNSMKGPITFSPSATSANLEGVGEIKFANQRNFNGLVLVPAVNLPPFSIQGPGTTSLALIPANDTSLCYLTKVEILDKNGNGNRDAVESCTVSIFQGRWFLSSFIQGRHGNNIGCEARCLSWGP